MECWEGGLHTGHGRMNQGDGYRREVESVRFAVNLASVIFGNCDWIDGRNIIHSVCISFVRIKLRPLKADTALPPGCSACCVR